MVTLAEATRRIDAVTSGFKELADAELRTMPTFDLGNEEVLGFDHMLMSYGGTDVAFLRRLLPLADEMSRFYNLLRHKPSRIDDEGIATMCWVTDCADGVVTMLASNISLLKSSGWESGERDRLINCASLLAEFLISKGGAAAVLRCAVGSSQDTTETIPFKETAIARATAYAASYFKLYEEVKTCEPSKRSELGRAIAGDDGSAYCLQRMRDVVDSTACIVCESIRRSAPTDNTMLISTTYKLFFNVLEWSWEPLTDYELEMDDCLPPGVVEGAEIAWSQLLRHLGTQASPQGALGMDFTQTCEAIIAVSDRLVSAARRSSKDSVRIAALVVARSAIPALQTVKDSVKSDPIALWSVSRTIMQLHNVCVAMYCIRLFPATARPLSVGLAAFCDDIAAAINAWNAVLSLTVANGTKQSVGHPGVIFSRVLEDIEREITIYYMTMIDSGTRVPSGETKWTVAMLNLSAATSSGVAKMCAGIKGALRDEREFMTIISRRLDDMDLIVIHFLMIALPKMQRPFLDEAAAPEVFSAAFAAVVAAAKRAHVAMKRTEYLFEKYNVEGEEVDATFSAIAASMVALAVAMPLQDEKIKRETMALLAVLFHLLGQEALGLLTGHLEQRMEGCSLLDSIVQPISPLATLTAEAYRAGVAPLAGVERGLDVLLKQISFLKNANVSSQTLETLKSYKEEAKRGANDDAAAVALAKALATLPCSFLGCTTITVRSKKCAGCSTTHYCGIDDLQKDWRVRHRPACRLLKKEREGTPETAETAAGGP